MCLECSQILPHRYYKGKCWIYKGRAGIEILLSTMKVACVDLSPLYYNPV